MEWFEDESLWRELYPYVFPAERVAAAAGQVEGIVSLTGVAGGAVLDLCCGPGRHAVEFALRGFAVTGVDASAFLLARARERAHAAGAGVEWVLDDMREFVRPASFDLACNLFTSFGYFEREDDNLRVLRNLYASLREGGALVLDMVGREHLEQVGLKARHIQFADGAVLTQQAEVNADWSRLESHWTLTGATQSRCYGFEHCLYSGPGLEARLLGCGFASVRLYGNLAGAPYGADALRLVAVARKA